MTMANPNVSFGWEYEFRGRRYKTVMGLFRAARKDNPVADRFFFNKDGKFCALKDKAELPYPTIRYPEQRVTVIA